MSHNCARSAGGQRAGARDANNNTLYAGGAAPACGGRGYAPPAPATNATAYPQQVTAKVLFGSVSAINDLKLQEKAAREARRTH